MGAERAQGGRGWVRIPASRGEQSPARPAAAGPYAAPAYGAPAYGAPAAASQGLRSGAYPSGDPCAIYLSLVKRWREAGRTLPGHPDEEWERLISQPCWPGR
ncbi:MULTISPECIES: hypothetical protein [unclassified Streptomyces]|uniref:hypothetical protein n=1 Tax=unclassified Streptomyces TaxID=2593676 RepID=UPI0036687B52